MAKKSSIKNPRCYAALKGKYGKSSAAAICNAQANRGRKGAKTGTAA